MSSKLREVIESLLELLDDFGINEEIVSISHENIVHRESLKTERTLAILRKAKSTLSEPVLNCEIGTVEDQKLRHGEWCRKHGIDGDMKVACAHTDMTCALCLLRWAQMPYEREMRHG